MSADWAKLIDAARLREAIAKAKDFALRQYSMRPEEVAPLLEAAEAFAETMPKLKKGWIVWWRRDGGVADSDWFDNEHEAAEWAETRRLAGFHFVHVSGPHEKSS